MLSLMLLEITHRVYHRENWHASNCTETEETWAGPQACLFPRKCVFSGMRDRKSSMMERDIAIAEEKKERELCVSPAIGFIIITIELIYLNSVALFSSVFPFQ